MDSSPIRRYTYGRVHWRAVCLRCIAVSSLDLNQQGSTLESDSQSSRLSVGRTSQAARTVQALNEMERINWRGRTERNHDDGFRAVGRGVFVETMRPITSHFGERDEFESCCRSRLLGE